VVFAMIGVLIAYLVVSAQRQPSRLLLMFITLMCFEVFFLAVVTWLAHPVLGELAWWRSCWQRAGSGRHAHLLLRGHRALGKALLGPGRAWRARIDRGPGGRRRRRGLVPAVRPGGRHALRTPALLGATLFHGCAIRAPS